MKVSARKFERAENAGKCLFVPARVTCPLPTRAANVRLGGIGMVCVEALLDRASGQSQGLPAHCGLQRFQVEFGETLPPQQGFDVPQKFSGEQAVERSFF